MCSTLEAENFNYENYENHEMTKKINNILFKLLCMDNFYEALDYIVLNSQSIHDMIMLASISIMSS